MSNDRGVKRVAAETVKEEMLWPAREVEVVAGKHGVYGRTAGTRMENHSHHTKGKDSGKKEGNSHGRQKETRKFKRKGETPQKGRGLTTCLTLNPATDQLQVTKNKEDLTLQRNESQSVKKWGSSLANRAEWKKK